MFRILHSKKIWLFLLITSAEVVTASVDDKVNSLTDSLLAAPAMFDLTIVYKIKGLRARQQQEKNQALDELILGLNAYMKGHFADAAEFLQKTSNSQYTRQLAEAALGVSLETLINDCRSAAENISCENCLGTTNNDCDLCSASGQKLCRKCKGFGKVRPEPENRKQRKPSENREKTVVCIVCNGLGGVRCEKCDKTGIVPCDCSSKVNTTTPPVSKIIDRMRFDNLIAIAKYLRKGGIDFFTPVGTKLTTEAVKDR